MNKFIDVSEANVSNVGNLRWTYSIWFFIV